MLNLDELKLKIEQKIPFAFTCECQGRDEDCAFTLNDPYANGRNDLARELIKLIETEQRLP